MKMASGAANLSADLNVQALTNVVKMLTDAVKSAQTNLTTTQDPGQLLE